MSLPVAFSRFTLDEMAAVSDIYLPEIQSLFTKIQKIIIDPVFQDGIAFQNNDIIELSLLKSELSVLRSLLIELGFNNNNGYLNYYEKEFQELYDSIDSKIYEVEEDN